MISSLQGRLLLALVTICAIPLSAGLATAQTVIATIPVSGFAGQGAVDSVHHRAYIPTATQVSVIDEKTNKVVGAIHLDTDWDIVCVAFDQVTNRLYVGAEFGGLFIVDPKSYATVGFVNVNAVSLAVNSLTDKIYASDFNSNLYVVDGVSKNIETTISINGIENISVNQVTNRVYAAGDYIPGFVAVVNGKTNKIIAQPQAASGFSFSTAVDEICGTFYSADQAGTLSVYNGSTNTRIASVSLPGDPVDVSVDPFTKDVYVTNYATNSVDIVDGATNELKKSVPVGQQPQYSVSDPFEKLLYVGTSSIDETGNTTYALSVLKTR